jgi:signal transduction histidine kinase/PAS domain-containing protein
MNVSNLRAAGSTGAAERFQQYLAKGQEISEFEFIRPDGETRVTQYHATRIDENFHLAILANITDRKRAELKLQRSEERFRSLFNAIPISTYTWQRVGDDFILLAYNEMAKTFSSGKVADLIGVKASELYRDEIQILHDFEQCFRQKSTIEREMDYRLKTTGERKSLSVKYAYIPPDLVMVHIEDFTERKQVKEALQHYADRLETIHQIDQAILTARSPEEIAQAAMKHIRQLIPCRRASIILFDFEAGQFNALAVDLDGETKVGPGKHNALSTFGGDIERLLQGEVHIEDNILSARSSSPVIQALHTEGIRSFINVPLLARGELIGALNLGAEESGSFTTEHIEIGREVANSLVIALQNVRLIETEQAARQQAEMLRDVTLTLTSQTNLAAVLGEILRQVHRLVPYSTAHIMLVEGDSLQIGSWYGYDAVGSEGLISRLEQPLADFPLDYQVVQSREAMVIPDTRQEPRWVVVDETAWIRSTLMIPISLFDRVLGVLRLDGRTPGEFSNADANRLQPLVGAAAIAVGNARLLEAERSAQEQLQNLAGYLQAARETERTRIAREVHDEFGQSLTALKIDVVWLSKHLPSHEARLQEKVKAMMELVDNTIQIVQHIATELRPGLLDDLGLSAALEWQTQEFAERTGVECELQLNKQEISYDRDLNTALFRMCQEMLTNITRHARANKVWVELRDEPDEVVFIVRDDGKGITKSQISHSKSLGLIGMRERARALGGEITFQGVRGQGTTVTARIPLTNNKKRKR